MLNKIFAFYKPKNAIVFTNTKDQVQKVVNYLNNNGINSLAIHGDLEQYQRNDVLIQFVNYSCCVLVATDLAARGLHIKELSMVINYDLPHDLVTYTHRIGRTARAGQKGVAVTIYDNRYVDKLIEYENDDRIFSDIDTLNTNQKFTLQAPNVTLVIEAGKKDKLRAGDILGALTVDNGLSSSQVGKISIYDRQSYVAIDRNAIDKAYSLIKNDKIKGRKFSTWILK